MSNKHNQSEISNLGAMLMILLGVGLLIAGCMLHLLNYPSYKGSIKVLSFAFGALFLSLGLYFGIKNYLSARKWKAIPAHWPKAPARNVAFRYSDERYTLPGRIHAQWTDADNQTRDIYSPEIGYDPSAFLSQSIEVRYAPHNPAKAGLDLSFLPDKVVFQSWPGIIAQSPELSSATLSQATPFEAAFSGFKPLNLNDNKHEQRMAVCQWIHPKTGALHVMEAQITTNEKEPFPDWKPGKIFTGAIRMDDPSVYWIDMRTSL